MINSHDPTPDSAATILTFKGLLSFLGRGALLAAALAVVAGGAAFVSTRNEPAIYRASASLLASQAAPSYGADNVIAPPAVDPSVYQAVLLQGPVVADALANLDGKQPTERQVKTFKRSMTVSIDKKSLSSVIRIGVVSHDAAFAAKAANGLADALASWDRNRARQAFASSVAALQQSIRSINDQLTQPGIGKQPDTEKALESLLQQRTNELAAAQTKSASAVFVGLLQPLTVASPPSRAAGPRLVFNTFVAAFLGILAAYALLFIRTSLATTVRDRDDLIGLGGGPVLAAFPRLRRRHHRLSGEVANFLRANLQFLTEHEVPLVLDITCARDALEKIGVAASVAESFARAGYRTLLVDADLRSSGSEIGFDLGSVECAPLEVHLENPDRQYPPAVVAIGGKQTFDFIPSTTPSAYPAELLSRGLPVQLVSWRDVYDVIVIDSPPVLPVADTLTIAPLCSGVLMCASLHTSRRRLVEEAVGLLRRARVNVVGSAITNVPEARRGDGGLQPHDVSVLDRQATDPYLTYTREPDGSGKRPSPLRARQSR